jgi:tetratricopeptide (TPR) repeat protein
MADEGAGFGALLRARRVAAGLSQEDLMQRSGLDVRTIRNLERGRARWPYPDTVRRLADALDLCGADRDVFTAAAGRRLVPGAAEVGGGAATASAPASPAPGEHRPVIPCELPGVVRAFVGRTDELAVLAGLLEHADQAGPGTVVISAIGGTAGVGKSALAIQWAHQVARQFPDGQLYVNLRGYDPDRPVPAADALAGFLRALGLPGQDIPPEADERGARYRSLLVGRRMLVVLDNAGSADQVRPLLPGNPACAVVVTSRDALAGLVARDGAVRLELDVLPPQDAVALLRALVGPRVEAEPGAAATLASQCCRLPLALRIAAELAATRPDVALDALTAELADLRTRLHQLEANGDPRTQVRTVFSWSYRDLDAEAARTFRLFGLHPGPDLDPHAAAALTGTSEQQARRALDTLARAHLIQPVSPGRHGMHDLLRSYARELSAIQDTEAGQHAALTRLFDHYLHSAATAMDTLYPTERHRRPRVPRPASVAHLLADPAATPGEDWLDAELANLTAIAHAAIAESPGHTTGLAATLFRHLDACGHYEEAVRIHSDARVAAAASGDRVAEALALTNLGVVAIRQGEDQQATGYLQEAHGLYRDSSDLIGQARTLHNLGILDHRCDRDDRAVRQIQQAIRLFREAGDRVGHIHSISFLGKVHSQLGNYELAAECQQDALILSREIGDRTGEGFALGYLSEIEQARGRYPQAASHLYQALAIFREIGNRNGEGDAHNDLGSLGLRQEHYSQAIGHFKRALAIFRETGDKHGQVDVLTEMGEALLAADDITGARTSYISALALASQLGHERKVARAYRGIAETHHAAGDQDEALRYRDLALTFIPSSGPE